LTRVEPMRIPELRTSNPPQTRMCASSTEQQQGPSRRELAAQAAENRARAAPSSLSGNALAAPHSAQVHVSSDGASAAPMQVDSENKTGASEQNQKLASAMPPEPLVRVVTSMDTLVQLVHCVFLGHGFRHQGQARQMQIVCNAAVFCEFATHMKINQALQSCMSQCISTS